MPTQKIDPKVIFASNAPIIDKPPVFSDKTKGWDVARANDGRPEIKQMNKVQQDTDLKILWLNENSVTPYDASIDYPDGAVAIKDGSLKQLVSGAWVEFLDNFANKDEVKRGIANRYDSSLTYNSGERVILTNGGIVKNTIDGNTNDPNVDMTGWRFDDNTVESIADLLAIPNPKNGSRVFVKSFHDKSKYNGANLALAKPFNGGGEFTYNSEKSSVNDSCMCFYGWERVGITEVDATLSGALADGSGRKLADLYAQSEYTLLYPNFVDTTASIDTIAIRATFKCVFDMRSVPRPAFDGSFTAHIKPVGEYVINAPVLMYAGTVKSYDSCITKASGYHGVMFYGTWSYVYDWDGGVFTSRDENTGAVWWIGPETDTVFNNEASQLRFKNFTVTRFKDVFAKFNSQSSSSSITGFRITNIQHVLGRGLTLDTTTGLYTEFLPKDFALQTNFRTPDWLVIGDEASWIGTGSALDTDLDSLFYVSSDTTFRNILGVPYDHKNGIDIAFCNAKRNVYFDNVRAGGEGGSFSLVNYFGNNTSPYPYYQSVISVNNSELVGLNVATDIQYTLAEPLTNNGALTLKLNRTDGLPDKGILRVGQLFEYSSINRATNTVNLVTPVFSYGSVGDNVATQTTICIVRLISGAPDQITFSDCYHGTEVGQLVGYSSYSDLPAVEAQFENCHLDVQTSALYPLYISGIGLPPNLFSVNPDKYNKQMMLGLARGANVVSANIVNQNDIIVIPTYRSLYNNVKYKVQLIDANNEGNISYYTVELCKRLSRDTDNYLLMTYDVKLTALSESVSKITSVTVASFISEYSNTQRAAPMWTANALNFGARLQFNFNQAVSGKIKIDLA